MAKTGRIRGRGKVKSCWRKPVKMETSFRKDRHDRGWFLIDVAREIGVSASQISRIERGIDEVADEMEIKDKLRKLYAGSRPPRDIKDPWKGQPFPTGRQLKMAMMAHGLTHRELAKVLQDGENDASDWFWWSYMNGDIDNRTKRPRVLSEQLQVIAEKFVRMTIEELEGILSPGEILGMFKK